MTKKYILFSLLFVSLTVGFIFYSNTAEAATGTSTVMSAPQSNNRISVYRDVPAIRLELNSTTTPQPENLDSVTIIIATSTNATSTEVSASSFEWVGVVKDNPSQGQQGLSDQYDTLLATSTVAGIGVATTIDIAAATTTPAIGNFFIVFKTSSSTFWTDNGAPAPGKIAQGIIVSIAANSVIASSTVATINATTTQPFIADTYSQQPDVTKISAQYQSGTYRIFDTNNTGGVGELGILNAYSTSTPGAVAIATSTVSQTGNTFADIGSTYIPSVWLDLNDAAQNATSSKVQYNLPVLPSVSSIKAFTDRIIFNTSKNLRGDQATYCPNYTVAGTALNCAGPGYPFIDFFGNQVVIRGLNLTSGSQISFSVSGIQDINPEGFPLSYSTTTLAVNTALIPTISSISPNSTTTGAAITVTGSNFGTATGTISFSGGFNPSTGPLPPVNATPTSWTTSQIIVTVPSNAQSGPIQITTSDGMMSDINEKSFFEVLGDVYIRIDLLSGGSTSTVATSANMRIFIGGPGGENVYYAGDTQGTAFNNSSKVYAIPNVSSMGFSWAFNTSGNYLSSMGSELLQNTSSTNPMILIFQGTTTKAVSGNIALGGTCEDVGKNKWVVAFAMPEGVETTMGPGGVQPSFFKTGGDCATTYALALPGNGTFRVESHLPPETAAAQLLDPSGQTITISDLNPTTTVNFIFTSANRKIYGRVVGGNGEPLSSQKYNELWIFAFQPKTDGKSSNAKANSLGYFSLYATEGVYKIGVGGPMMPFPTERDITVDSSDTFALNSTTTSITIKLEPPTTYVSGYVKDGAGNGISNVDIYGWCEGGPGGGQGFTDSQGFYKMYVSPCSNYHVGGFTQNYGQLTEQTGIAVTPSSNPTVNFTLSSADFITVSGTVTKNNASSSNVDVWITQAQFGPGIGGARTNFQGVYQITIKKGYSNLYLHAAIPGQGEFYSQVLSSAALNASTTRNISVNIAVIEIRLAPGNTFEKAFIGAHSLIGDGFTNLRLATSSSHDTYKIEVPYNSGGTNYVIEGGIPDFGPIPATSTTISTSTTININLGSISFYTVSGTVTATGTSATATDAFVWAGGLQGGGGTKVGSDGTFSLKLRQGNYDIGVGKAGYAGSILKNQNISTTTTGLGLTLTKNTQTISGYVKYGNTFISNARIWADNGTGGWSGTVSEADGGFLLNVGTGEWKVGAAAEGYSSNPIRITAPASGIIIGLSFVDFDPKRKQQSIKPNEGGVIQTDDAKVEIPSGALGSGTTETSIKVQNTMNVPGASGAKIISSKAKSITASYSTGNNAGQTISTLAKNINIEFVLTKLELISSGISDLDSAKKVKIGYFDETVGNWVEITTVVTTNPSDATWANLVSITLKGSTVHLSDFAPMYSTEGAPPTPTNLTATAGNSQVALSWSSSTGATKYNIYRKNGDLYPFSASTTATTYTNTGLTNGTTYYYKVSALNDAEQESAATAEVSATPVAAPSGGGGGAAADLTPPAISQIAVTVGDTQATISWKTNESSISWLVYGTTTAYGLEIKTTTSTLSHSLTLTGLSASTTYHYQVKSKDSTGNIGAYTDKTFTTLATGVVTTPETIPAATTTPPVELSTKPVSEMTDGELRTEISKLIVLIAQLQSQLGKPKIEGIPAGFNFEKNLVAGATEQNVVHLKIILANEGCLKGVKNTKWFGPVTLAGVKCLCQKYKEDISKTAGYEVKCTGFVGKGMRAKLNELLGK